MKKFGLLILLGVAAAGAAYALKKKNSQDEDIIDDINEFDGVADDDIDPEDTVEAKSVKTVKTMKQKYTSLSSNKDDFVGAAKNTLEAAKGMIEPVKGMAGDIKDIIVEKAGDAGIVAGDYYNDAKGKVEEVIGQAKDKLDSLKLEDDDNEVIDIDITEDTEEDQ